MRYRHLWCCLAVLATGCVSIDRAIFVTSTSIGINVDNKPPTASIAYDRTEGYLGPRYANGAVPPVVASIETGGTVLSPQIRQVYATGGAAVRATGGNHDGSRELTGGKAVMFFGTSTTIGLKVGAGPSGYPDTLAFGYKRKEFSYIPLGSTGNPPVDAYPSVFASIDTIISTAPTTQGGTAPPTAGTGMSTQQFFATGESAEALAGTEDVRTAFKTLAASQPKLAAKAAAAAAVDSQQQSSNLERLMAYVAPGGTLNRSALAKLISDAKKNSPDVNIPHAVTSQTKAEGLRSLLADEQTVVEVLAKVIPK